MDAGCVMAAVVAREHVEKAATVCKCVDVLWGVFLLEITNSSFVNRAPDSIQKPLPRTPRATVQDAIDGVELV